MADESAKTAVAETDGMKIKLNVPVKFGEESIEEIVYRKPTGADIIRCGHPLKINFTASPPEFTFDEQKMGRMMSALAGQPPSVIDRLDPNDWSTYAWAIAGFFTPDLRQI